MKREKLVQIVSIFLHTDTYDMYDPKGQRRHPSIRHDLFDCFKLAMCAYQAGRSITGKSPMSYAQT